MSERGSKVYVVIHTINYEGCEIVSVHADAAEARKKVGLLNIANSSDMYDYDLYELEEHVIE